MRSMADRIRHAIAFELIGLFLVIIILSRFGFDPTHTGILGLAFSIIATGWNYLYNIWFDKVMIKMTGHCLKKTKHRILHAVLFELGLLIVSLPALSWWFNITLLQAFIMDIGLVIFYLIYAYIYNLAYDHLFPIKQSQ